MISESDLKNIALQAGLSKSEILEIKEKAIEEAKALGKQHDDDYVLSIIRTFSGLDEEDINYTIKKLNTKFIESGCNDFDEFLEDTWTSTAPIGSLGKSEVGIQSTDFPPSVRPEHKLGHTVKFPPEDLESDDDKKEENLLPGTGKDKNGLPIPAIDPIFKK